ncbi:MAG: MarR family transcriptional regulator [Firmicutes bacterium]|nr:MarR family transcriptional regulator [Bacillota bacterium]
MHDQEVGMEVHSLTKLIRRHLEKSINFQYAKSITGTNGWIIAYLAENCDKDIFQKDLEEKFSVTRSTISKVVKLMEQKGLIERCSVPDDARLKKLVLTPRAIDLHYAIKEDIKNLEATLTRGFTQEEIDDFFSYIERMKSNLNE